MLRRHSNIVLAAAAAVLVAAVIGVQLGHSAISEINPIHFQGAAMPPQGLDPATVPPPPENSYAQAYGWEQGFAARDHDCRGNCDALETRRAAGNAVATVIGAPGSGGPYWRDATPTSEPAPWPPGETGSRPLSVERYMHYPVEGASDAETVAAPKMGTAAFSRDVLAAAPAGDGKK